MATCREWPLVIPEITNTACALPSVDVGLADGGAPPYLVLAHDAQNPLARGARFLIHEVDEIVFGRGENRRAARLQAAGGRQLALSLPDEWISRQHARLARRDGGWWLNDRGSKNGTRMNGAANESRLLVDGDVFVVGRTFWVFREGQTEGPRDLLGELDTSGAGDGDRSLHTFSGRLAATYHQLRRIAPTAMSVLVTGQTGTGKDVLAQAVHQESGRAGPLIPVNCGALPTTLIEAELFGVRRGVYTGASDDRLGLVRAAAEGTLFLDEIGDLPMEVQGVLLRVLEQREVTPLGGTKPIPVNVRVIAATNCDLQAMIAAGTFRRDLYARLAGFVVQLPPLAQRREDLGFLLAAALRRAAPERAHALSVDPELSEWLFAYGWPGNVRELVQVAATLCAVADSGELRRADLPLAEILDAASSGPVEQPPGVEPRVRRIAGLLRQHRGNLAAVARELGTSRSQVRRLVARYGLDLGAYRT